MFGPAKRSVRGWIFVATSLSAITVPTPLEISIQPNRSRRRSGLLRLTSPLHLGRSTARPESFSESTFFGVCPIPQFLFLTFHFECPASPTPNS